ncbi:unnamed protein product [Sympodiomycopsis kandeliae]
MSGSAAPADEFLSSIERDIRGGSGGGGGHDRTSPSSSAAAASTRRHHRDDYYSSSSHSRRDDHDRDASRKRRSDRDRDRDRDREGSPRSSRRRYDDHRGDDGDYRRRDEDEYRGHRSRRRVDEDHYRSSRGPPPPTSSSSSSRRDPYDDDPYESRRSSRRAHDDYSRGGSGNSRRGGGGGGGGGWRDAPMDANPRRFRSPTPPGTRPISRRIRANSKWDQVAKDFEGVSAIKAKESGLFGSPGQPRTVGVPGGVIGRDANGQAIVPEALPPLRFGAEAQAAGGPMSTQVGSGQTAANRQSRRLYVGNVGHGITEAIFMRFWNERLKEMNMTIAPGDPAVSATCAPDKGYAFIEFRCPEEATSAMSFDGVIYQGQALKIRRPKDYTGTDLAPPPIHVPGVISTNVPDSPNKIYIGSIPTYLDEGQIIELLQAFGEVRAFNLVREANNGPSKGFAFCEYVNPEVTDAACQGLSDLELGDRKLIAQRASAGQKGASNNSNGMTGANSGPLGTRSININASETGDPTNCMTMLNMVTPQELIDDEEYSEIVEDIREECAKYGVVTDVRIPRPVAQSKGLSAQAWSNNIKDQSQQDGKEREGVGRVYIRFQEVSQCEAALKSIAGRSFGGRLVICAFLSENDWPGEEDGGESKDATKGMIDSHQGPSAE